MLNIRLNLTINLKKLLASGVAGFILAAHLVTPAYALSLPVQQSVKPEKAITVSLSHMKLQTTRTGALEAISSPYSKFFDAEALAFLTVYTQGWTMQEWNCLRYVWTKESHFNPKALNKSSGAFGIAQFMPSTWGNYKVEKTADAGLQIKYGLRYIEKRYGSTNEPTGACNAKQFWVQNGWY